MFLTMPERPNIPFEGYLNFSCEGGHFFISKDGKREVYDLPQKFIYIGEKRGVSGWCDADNCGIYSNKVDNTTKEELRVMTSKGGLIAQGIYKDIKEQIKANGGKFCSFVYIIFDGKLMQLELSGARLFFKDETQAGWTNYSPIKGRYTVVQYTKQGKKGKTVFLMPVFENGDVIPESEMGNAIEKAKLLDKYYQDLKEYEKHFEDVNENTIADVKSDFVADTAVKQDAQDVFFEDKKISISDLPF